MAIIGNITLFLEKTTSVELLTAMRGQISNAFLVGQIIGLLGFGILIDKLGRKVGALYDVTTSSWHWNFNNGLW